MFIPELPQTGPAYAIAGLAALVLVARYSFRPFNGREYRRDRITARICAGLVVVTCAFAMNVVDPPRASANLIATATGSAGAAVEIYALVEIVTLVQQLFRWHRVRVRA